MSKNVKQDQFINVVVIQDNIVYENYLFESAKLAEKKFRELAANYSIPEEDMKDYIEDGYFQVETDTGEISFCISWPVL